jgi:signal transduction histidine kinase
VTSLRAQLVGSTVATLIGIVGVTAYAWHALANASDAAEVAEGYLARIGVVARIEEQIHYLNASGATASPATLARLRKDVAELQRIRWESPEDAEQVTRLAAWVAEGRLDEAAELVSAVEERAVDRSLRAIGADTQKPARKHATTVVEIGCAVVLLFGILSSFILWRYLRERRRALEAFRRSERMAALGAVAASMAHELNSPLATITGCASALRSRRERDEGDGQDEPEYLEMIESEARRCSGIVGNLGDLARDAPLAVMTSRLGDIAQRVVRLVETAQKDKRIVFEVDAEPDVEILCDPDKIKQLLLNLLLNASEASDDGGHVRIEIRRQDDQTAAISVTDDGKGISPRDLPQIFDAFYTEKSRGLGFGLFVCQRIATLHGGSIHAASDGPGRGARFEVLLPVG